MGKRSPGTFARRPHDSYQTPYEAVLPLLPHLAGVTTYAEPCCGEGLLISHLVRHRLTCTYAGDIQTGDDALFWFPRAHEIIPDIICTNPPWTRQLLHPLINHFMRQCPTWLLFDADWAHTLQAAPYLPHCAKIVAVGRVKWIAQSAFESKDNAAWYLFDRRHTAGASFFGLDPSFEIEKQEVAA